MHGFFGKELVGKRKHSVFNAEAEQHCTRLGLAEDHGKLAGAASGWPGTAGSWLALLRAGRDRGKLACAASGWPVTAEGCLALLRAGRGPRKAG